MAQSLTPATLDALEAALAKATPGEWASDYSDVHSTAGIVGDIVCQPNGDCKESLESWPANRHLIALAHNTLPALIAAARLTVPEVISNKHYDREWWQVWDGENWVKARWRGDWEAWQRFGGNSLPVRPTHALPMPPAPEGTDA
jgi:hypothetical protein